MDFQKEVEVPEPLIYQALEAFMEIYEDMWKYVECDYTQFHKRIPSFLYFKGFSPSYIRIFLSCRNR